MRQRGHLSWLSLVALACIGIGALLVLYGSVSGILGARQNIAASTPDQLPARPSPDRDPGEISGSNDTSPGSRKAEAEPEKLNIEGAANHAGKPLAPPNALASPASAFNTGQIVPAASIHTAADGFEDPPLRTSRRATAIQVAVLEQQAAAQAHEHAAPHPRVHDLPTSEWLLNAAPQHYVVQLIGAWHTEELEEFLRQGSIDTATLTYLPSRRKGKPWHVLLLGRYASVEAARAEINRLPAGLRVHGPWIRKISDLQRKIRATHGG